MRKPMQEFCRWIEPRAFFLHLGFHTFWVFLYLVSLLGVFILIPFVGSYNAFVLGFLGETITAKSTSVALAGFAVFAVSGLIAGRVASMLKWRRKWLFSVLSVIVTCFLMIAVSLTYFAFVGARSLAARLPLPASTGSAGIDELKTALQLEYHMVGTPAPPYLPGMGTVVSFIEVKPKLRLLPSDFQRPEDYRYINLPAPMWNTLRKVRSGKLLLLWKSELDLNAKRLVITIDLTTDQFGDEFLTEEVFNQRVHDMESVVRKHTGDQQFSLSK